jgi:riboflavin synthase
MYGSRVMFTGLIESVGRLERIDRTATGFRLVLATDLSGELVPGESLAVNGVCLTVVEAGADGVHADVSPETGRVTSLGTLEAGSLVNLERSLRADGRIGGHFVQGHVDGTGRIEAIEREGDARRLRVTIPAGFELYVVEKGSIAVDGISLTVASLSNKHLDVQIIPFTWQHTNLRVARVGTLVNVECDILGKYVAKALGDRRG